MCSERYCKIHRSSLLIFFVNYMNFYRVRVWQNTSKRLLLRHVFLKLIINFRCILHYRFPVRDFLKNNCFAHFEKFKVEHLPWGPIQSTLKPTAFNVTKKKKKTTFIISLHLLGTFWSSSEATNFNRKMRGEKKEASKYLGPSLG